MKRLLVLLLAACALLYACGAQPSLFHREDPGETTPPTTAPTVPGETTGPTEPPEAAYRHPLTGAPLDAPFAGRCTAVVINNIRQAQPLYGIGQADVLYEIIAEGGGSITRCLGIFSEIGSVEKIGSIRSARTYLVDLARATGRCWSTAAAATTPSTSWRSCAMTR